METTVLEQKKLLIFIVFNLNNIFVKIGQIINTKIIKHLRVAIL